MSTSTVPNTAAPDTRSMTAGSAGCLPCVSAVSNNSVLKYTKSQKHWWFFGPVVLAIVMFLLMGTIFEHRIEAFWRGILERRQAVLAAAIENQDPPLLNNSLHAVKTPSQRTIVSCKTGSVAAIDNSEVKTEPKNFCCTIKKKEHKDEELKTMFLNEGNITTTLIDNLPS